MPPNESITYITHNFKINLFKSFAITYSYLLAKQGQNTLICLVGLRQHCLTGLSQNLVVGVGNHLCSHIRIADCGLCSLSILYYVVQVGDGVLRFCTAPRAAL